MTSNRKIYLAVIGVGGVGQHFLSQLETVLTQAVPSSPNILATLHLIYVARSTKALLSRSYEPIAWRSWPARLAESETNPLSNAELVDYLSKAPGRAILVDNTSSSEIADFYPRFLTASISVVTPSKIAFSSSLDLWRAVFGAAANGAGRPGSGYIFHESTVGAGLPIISTIRDLNNTGNAVTRIEGILSGTLSLLLNNLMPASGGGSSNFSAEVKKAKQSGETEPDPRNDLSGLDVARKCTILARLCGLPIKSPTSFPVQSLIPETLKDCNSGEEFLDRLSEYDGDFLKVKEKALAENKVLRYVGSVDVVKGECEVGLRQFDAEHSFALMKGGDLQLSLHTARYKTPIVIQGSGDGAYLGILSDLIKTCEMLL